MKSATDPCAGAPQATRLALAVPLLLAFGARSVYLGPAFGLSAHATTITVLAFGLDGPFDVAAVGGERPVAQRRCSSMLVPAHTLHQLHCGTTTMAFVYIDPLGRDEQRLRARVGAWVGGLGVDLDGEAALIDGLRALAAPGPGRSQRFAAWLDQLQLDHEARGDARVRRSLAALARDPAATHSLAELARAAHLSTSRYLHLFKLTTGVPLRRYRLWLRIGAAVRAIARGERLTEAALAAGFSSSAHFSAVFRAMFGMAPSQLARAGLSFRDVAQDGAETAPSVADAAA